MNSSRQFVVLQEFRVTHKEVTALSQEIVKYIVVFTLWLLLSKQYITC